MATYVKTLITDASTDEDSPGTETLFQDIIQSINYLIDVTTNAGANSEALDISGTDIATFSELYESAWTQITTGNDNNFAHGLGRTPIFISVFRSGTTGWADSYHMGSNDPHVNVVDATNIHIDNDTGGTVYIKVFAF